MQNFFENIFENIGRKLKIFAIVIFVLGIVGTIIGLISMMVLESGVGFVIILAGGFFALLSVFLMYAAGEIVEQLQMQTEKLSAFSGEQNSQNSTRKTYAAAPVKTYAAAPVIPARGDSDWFCTNCGKGNIAAVASCQYCGKRKETL